MFALGGAGLLVFDLSDRYQPVKIAELSLAGYYPLHLAIGDSVLFVGTQSGNVLCIDVADPSSPNIRGSAPTSGLTSSTLVARGRRAFISSIDFPDAWGIDATNLDSVKTAELTGFPRGWSNTGFILDTLWVYGRLNELIVVSISNCDTPRLVSQTPLDTTLAGIAGRDTLLCVVTKGGTVVLYSLQDPAQPRVLSTYTWSEPTYYRTYAITISDSLLHVANVLGLLTLSIAPTVALEFSSFFPTVDYLSRADFAGQTVYVASGLSGLWTVDVSDPSSPLPGINIRTGGWCTSVLCSYPYLFLTSDASSYPAPDTASGLWVFDISDQDSPIVVNRLMMPGSWGLARSGTLLFISRPYDDVSDTTVHIIDVSDAIHPTTVGAILGGYTAHELAARDSLVFLASLDSGLFVYDCHDPANPHLLSKIFRNASGVVLDDSIAYVHRRDSVMVLDIQPPESLQVVAKIHSREDGWMTSVAQMGLVNTTLLCVGSGVYTGFDVRDPTHPVRLEDSPRSRVWNGFGVHQDTVFLLGRYEGLWVLSLDRVSSVEERAEAGVASAIQIEVYPNPANGLIHVRVSSPHRGRISVDLCDVLGRRVRSVFSGYSEGFLETSLDISPLATGVYFLHVIGRPAIATRKILVVK